MAAAAAWPRSRAISRGVFPRISNRSCARFASSSSRTAAASAAASSAAAVLFFSVAASCASAVAAAAAVAAVAAFLALAASSASSALSSSVNNRILSSSFTEHGLVGILSEPISSGPLLSAAAISLNHREVSDGGMKHSTKALAMPAVGLLMCTIIVFSS